MKKHLLLGFLLFISGSLAAQHPPQWINATNDYFKTGVQLAVDNQSNLVVTGFRPSFAGNGHIFTRKTDASGNLLWEQTDSTGVAWKFEKPGWVNVDASDNIYVCGYRYTGTINEYTDTIIALKYDPSGNLLWKREIGHIWPGPLQLRSDLDAAGNLYIGTVGLSPGFDLIKLDPSGNLVYQVSDASSQNQNFTSMRMKNHMVVMCSYAFNGSQISVCAFDTSGNFLWSHLFPGRGGMDVEIDDSLNVYILSQDFNPATPGTNMDIELFKFDLAGNQISQSNFDFGGYYDAAVRMTLVNNKLSIIGTSILTGQAYMDWITFQTDLSGNKLWDARYGFSVLNDEKPSWVTAMPDGDVFVSGQGGPDTVGSTGTAFLRYVTVKYRNGNTLWTDAHPYQGYVGVANASDGQCGLYVLGETYMTAMHYSDSCAAVGLNHHEDRYGDPVLFPNPASETFSIQFDTEVPAAVAFQVLDVSGRICREADFGMVNPGTFRESVSVNGLASGVYMLKLQIGQSVLVKKLSVSSAP